MTVFSALAATLARRALAGNNSPLPDLQHKDRASHERGRAYEVLSRRRKVASTRSHEKDPLFIIEDNVAYVLSYEHWDFHLFTCHKEACQMDQLHGSL